MNLELEGKVTMVTGGSRGLGKAIVLRLAEEGCSLAICARGEEAGRVHGVGEGTDPSQAFLHALELPDGKAELLAHRGVGTGNPGRSISL